MVVDKKSDNIVGTTQYLNIDREKYRMEAIRSDPANSNVIYLVRNYG